MEASFKGRLNNASAFLRISQNIYLNFSKRREYVRGKRADRYKLKETIDQAGLSDKLSLDRL